MTTTISRYDLVDKSTWPEGPWHHEPDKVEWRDPDSALPCLIVRGPSGALCGYVGVHPGHPHHGADYLPDLDVHGGITFSGPCMLDTHPEPRVCHTPVPGEPDVWWLGFDTAHYLDRTPGTEATLASIGRDPSPLFAGSVYRDLDYVKSEVKRLAAQLM